MGILNAWAGGGLSSSRNPTKLNKTSFLSLDLKQAHQRAVDGGAVCIVMAVWSLPRCLSGKRGTPRPADPRAAAGANCAQSPASWACFKQELCVLEVSRFGVLLGFGVVFFGDH